MIQDIALWIKQIPKQAGFVPVMLYVLFQIMNMASFAFTCLVVNKGKGLVFKIKIGIINQPLFGMILPIIH